jgi:hypothetical protein
MAPQAHGSHKGAHSKATHKKDTIKSLLGSSPLALLKSRTRYTPAPGPDFSVSLETEERFVVAVCNVLVWHSIREATSNIISDKEMCLQVRTASLTEGLAQPLCSTYSSILQAYSRANA